jgi:hypothetical protein
MKHATLAIFGIIVVLNGCVTKQAENTSVRNTVYMLESVKDIPTGAVFSFRDYCVFNAKRGLADSDLDKTLAESNARLELHFYNRMADLKLVSGINDTSAAFLEYQEHYRSRFFFTENKNTVELTLNINNFNDETKTSIEALSPVERDAILKSVFKKSKDGESPVILIEPDEEDDVINYWRRIR